MKKTYGRLANNFWYHLYNKTSFMISNELVFISMLLTLIMLMQRKQLKHESDFANAFNKKKYPKEN